MDVFSHAVLPLALWALLLRRPAPERLAAALGGAAPDMDFFLAWVTRLGDPFYAFVHRGLSHTLWGAPLFALVGLALLASPWAARAWPRLAAFRLTPATALAAALGGLTHLALDMLTISGVPLLWPLSVERFTLNVYFFSALYMTPVAAYAVWRLYKGRLSDALLARVAAVLVAMLAVSGAVRLAAYPHDAPPGAVVQPAALDGQWVVAEPVADGWVVRTAGWAADGRAFTFTGNATPEAQPAVERAEALGAYTSWRWRSAAPVVNATPLGDGGWRVEFRDAFALHRNATGSIFQLVRMSVPLVVEVHGDAAVVRERPGGWGIGG